MTPISSMKGRFMKIIGIIAEYNPFHIGHRYHLDSAIAAAGGDAATLCVMSGDFVQRGEAAIFSKFARAQAAVLGGVNLVLELPLPWAISSAEGFSRGGVGLLSALGCVDYLSFGSETGDLEQLQELAVALMDPAIMPLITREMKSGVPFARARQTVIEREFGEIGAVLANPNDTLAVEYLKAIFELRSRLKPLPILRVGAMHDGEGGSASEIRGLIAQGKDPGTYVPSEVKKLLEREMNAGRGPITVSRLERPLLSRLRMLPSSAFDELPDASEGLGGRLFDAARSAPSLDALYSEAKTKRYPLSRIRRMSMCAALGLRAGDNDGTPPYARVLAADETGRQILRQMEAATIPIITKPADSKSLPPETRRIFELGSSAHDLFVLGYRSIEDRRGGGDYRATPFIL
jgi:predicted nucleotidyltransferase